MSIRQANHGGDLTPAAFAARFRESSRVLWCVAAGVLGDRSHADDVLQEAAVAALGKLGDFRPGTSFVAWMSQYVRFVALNHRRKQERRQRALDTNRSATAQLHGHSPTDGSDVFDASVRRALDELGETPRICLLLKTVIELEYSEIAELLEIPAGTAMSHVSRARAKMQQILQEPQLALRTGEAG